MILEGNNGDDCLEEDDSDLDKIDLYYNREEEILKKQKDRVQIKRILLKNFGAIEIVIITP